MLHFNYLIYKIVSTRVGVASLGRLSLDVQNFDQTLARNGHRHLTER